MMPLYQDPHFTFHFADDRRIPRFHLDGVPLGQTVQVYRFDPATGRSGNLLATAQVGADGWVDLPEPLVVRAGEALVAVPRPVGPVGA